ncbi:uncharacterized protein C106.07c [Aspergillus udagawae]|uniref:Uncharacterized protein C106.07c n=1 Tax=Aspergillus udagawae TaxID=91492 RepID=A0ABQ1BC04_9EURO|nr:uncharacterized protein C106.07c [Aspergillus udagawae]GFF98106.1 uncharacterized protein C106.07c [Aspergillus udagawae]GFG13026.1 uncharacterized protein C106.07c [Aspergillus udagawae]
MSLRFISTPRWFSHFISQAGHAPSSSSVRKNVTFSQTLFTPNVVASFPSRRAFASAPAWKPNPQYRFFSRRWGSTTTFTYNPSSTLQRSTFRRFNSSRANQSARPAESGSLSQRLKKLSREYGWAALGVYLLLSAMDFPFCFIAVRQLGAERIGHYEHVVVETVKGLFGVKSAPEEQSQDEVSATQSGQQTTEAQKKNNGDGASLWTQLALAYAVHKTLIFIRVPLTAAITPKVVKVLRVWGWDLAKRRPRGM